MKNFEERKAEVFHRSEERIRAKANIRRRVIAVCIPLLLCMSAIVLVSRPWSGGEGGILPNSTVPAALPSPTVQHRESLVEISLGGYRKTYCDAVTVGAIAESLNSLSSTKIPVPEIGNTGADFGVNASSTVCRITVRTGTDTAVFILSGIYLKSETTGNVYQLSQNERKELNALLGISQHETQ